MNDPNELYEEDTQRVDPQDIQNAIDRVERIARNIQQHHLDQAQFAGFIVDMMGDAREIYSVLTQQVDRHLELPPLIASGTNHINAIDLELAQYRESYQISIPSLYAVASSTSTFVTTSDTAAMAISHPQTEKRIIELPPFLKRNEEDVTRVFETLDPSLAQLYNEIWQAYYGTTADNVRAAIGLMRQAFDHFFHILAPDDKVIKSSFWKPKEGDDPRQIYRRERIEHAIYTHVQDHARANTLAASLDQILKTYKVLNRLHTRGELRLPETRQALFTMKRFLEDFADALNL